MNSVVVYENVVRGSDAASPQHLVLFVVVFCIHVVFVSDPLCGGVRSL